jgi:hypothetical protein
MQEKREKSKKTARALAYIEKKVYFCTLFVRVWHELCDDERREARG